MTELLESKCDQTIHSFLMIGQSNMAGRGDLGEVEPIRNDKCFMLRNGRWQPMSEPINPDRAIVGMYPSGISLAASFADAYAKATGKSVGLIPCADGGTAIAQWQPGQILFDHAMVMTKLALRSSELQGVLWHQGESDCASFEAVEKYPCQFLRMIEAIRERFPGIPIVVGELSEKITYEDRTDKIIAFNQQLHRLVSGIDRCTIVSSEGLTLRPDNLHFNARSLRTFGVRYFDAFCSLKSGS